MHENPVQDTIYALAAGDGVYYAARQSGLWVSGDDGQTWQHLPVTGGNETLPVTAVALSPKFAKDGLIFAGVNGAILRSNDRGKTWSAVALPLPSPVITGLAVSPGGEYSFAATMEDGIFRSQDGGRTWQSWNFGLFDRSILCIAVSPDFARDRTVYLGTETGLFCSRNEGRTWREITLPGGAFPILCVALSPDFARDGVIFAGTETAGLFRSADRGSTWQRVLNSRAVNGILLSADFGQSASVLAVTPDALWRSDDGGFSWSAKQPVRAGSGVLTAAVLPCRFTPEKAVLIGTAEGEIVWA